MMIASTAVRKNEDRDYYGHRRRREEYVAAWKEEENLQATTAREDGQKIGHKIPLYQRKRTSGTHTESGREEGHGKVMDGAATFTAKEGEDVHEEEQADDKYPATTRDDEPEKVMNATIASIDNQGETKEEAKENHGDR